MSLSTYGTMTTKEIRVNKLYASDAQNEELLIFQENADQILNIDSVGTLRAFSAKALTVDSDALISIGATTSGPAGLNLLTDTVGINMTANAGGIAISTLASGTIEIDSVGAVAIESSGAAITIGGDPIAQALNLGTAGARTIAMGSASAGGVTIDSGAVLGLTGGTGVGIMATTGTLVFQTNAEDANMTCTTLFNGDFVVTTTGTEANVDINAGGTLSLEGVGAVLMESNGSTIGIGTQTNTGAINIGTAGARTVTVGNDASTKVDVNALIIELDSAGTIIMDSTTSTAIGATTTIDLQATTGLTLDSAGSTAISIGADTNTGAINIGTAGARTVTVGNDASTKVDVNALIIELDSAGTIIMDSTTSTAIGATTTIDLQATTGLTIDSAGATAIGIGADANTGAINIGTAGARTVTVGNDASTKVDVNALIIELDSAGTIVMDATTTIDLQATTGLTLDSAGSTAISIGADANTGAINVGTVGARTITVGNDASTKVDVNALIIELDSAGTIVMDATTTIDLQATTGLTLDSAGSTAISIGTDANTGAINVGTVGARTITVGNDASTKVDVNALIIELDSAGTIIMDSTTSTAIAATTTIDIQATTGLTLDSAGATVIGIGTDTNTGAINIGTAGARTVTVGNDASTKVDVNALIIELDSAGTIIMDSTTSTAIGATTTIDLQATTGLTIDSAGATAIGIGTDANTGAINVGTAGARTITVGNDTSTIVDINALDITLDAGDDIVINAVGLVDIDATEALTIDSAASITIGATGGAINIGGAATTGGLTLTAGVNTDLTLATSGNGKVVVTGDLEVTGAYSYHEVNQVVTSDQTLSLGYDVGQPIQGYTVAGALCTVDCTTHGYADVVGQYVYIIGSAGANSIDGLHALTYIGANSFSIVTPGSAVTNSDTQGTISTVGTSAAGSGIELLSGAEPITLKYINTTTDALTTNANIFVADNHDMVFGKASSDGSVFAAGDFKLGVDTDVFIVSRYNGSAWVSVAEFTPA
jgi:hypothetical protein